MATIVALQSFKGFKGKTDRSTLLCFAIRWNHPYQKWGSTYCLLSVSG